MKKILLLSLLFISAFAHGQVFQKPVGYGFEYRRLITDTLFAFPSDTFPVATNLKSYLWAARKGDSTYLWSPVQDKWVLNSGGGGSGGGTDNTNLGAFYRLLVPSSQGIKGIAAGYGTLWDSTTNANSLTSLFDSTTVFPQLRATILSNNDSLFGVLDNFFAANRTVNMNGKSFRWGDGGITNYLEYQIKDNGYLEYNIQNSGGTQGVFSSSTPGSWSASAVGLYGSQIFTAESNSSFLRSRVGNDRNQSGQWIDFLEETYNDGTNGGSYWFQHREKWTGSTPFTSSLMQMDSLGVSMRTKKAIGSGHTGYIGLLVDSNSNVRFENYPSSRNDGLALKVLTIENAAGDVDYSYLDTTFYATKTYAASVGGGGGGIDSTYADTTFLKVADYTADQKRGNVLGTVFDESSFANLDDFAVGAGSTPTVSGGKITDTVGSASCLTCYVGLAPTMLERWTITAGFTVDDKTGTSYGVQIGTYSINSVYLQNIRGFINLRSSGIYQGRLDLVDGQYLNNTLVSSTSNISFSVGDSIEITLTRNVNIFTFIARNVTTGAAEISISYTYTGSTTAANTGIPLFAWRGGKQSLYSFKFSSDESIETQLLLRGDSKMTWYGNNVTQRIPNMTYQMFGNAVSQSGSGDMLSQVVSTLDETISLSPEKVLITAGSNDIRNLISAGTWQANIDTIWNKLRRNGIEVFFSLMYETAIDQSALITYLLLNYPDNTILDGYYATQECNSCLLPDNIHLTAYGNKKWLEATAESGVIDFFNHFREMKFTAGDALYTAVGDSLAINRYFATSNKVNVFREGVLQWPLEEGEAGDGYRRRGDTIIFIPDLASDEKIIIQTYNRIQWVAIEPQAAPFDFLLADFPNAERAYSVGRKLNPLYSGSCIKVRDGTTNSEYNIGYTNNVLDTVTLKSVIGSNSAYIVTVYDNSGNGEDATQSSSSLQPRIMNAGVIDRVQNDDGDWVPAMYFDGSNDYLQYTGVNADGVNWSTWMVSKRTSSGVFGGIISSTTPALVAPIQHTDGNIYILSVNGANFNSRFAADGTATFCLLNGFYHQPSGTPYGYKDGSSISFGSSSFSTNTTSAFNTIGNYANSVYTTGHIAEVVIYQSDQSSNRTGIDLNINSFWKLY